MRNSVRLAARNITVLTRRNVVNVETQAGDGEYMIIAQTESEYLQALGGEPFVASAVPCVAHEAEQNEHCFPDVCSHKIPKICAFRLHLFLRRHAYFSQVYELEGKRMKNL